MIPISKDRLVKIIKQHKWWVQVFNGLPLYLHTVASNTGWMIKPVSGVNFSHFFLRIHEHRAHYYYDEMDLTKIGFGFYKKNSDIGQLNKFVAQHQADYFKAKKQTGPINKPLLKNLSLKQLTELAQKLCRELSMAIGITHSIEGISFVSEIKLKEILNRRNIVSHNIYQLLSAPFKPSFLNRAQAALWQIQQAKPNRRILLAKKFLQNFDWIDNSYVQGKILTVADVLKKAKNQKKVPTKQGFLKIKQKKYKLVKKLSLNKREMFVIKTIETSTSWQDDRKMLLMQTIGRFEPVVEEISKRLRVSPEQFKYIYSQELTFDNLSSKKFLAKFLARYPHSCYYALKNTILVYPGQEAKYIEKHIEQKQAKQVTELTGQVACRGVIKGRVKICRTIHDIPKVKKGEILVASMTRPEFLPAMQKAAAFVTDEGGITSHASIVSREMHKPCIIGTKIATEVFKNGDLVEVDANHGVVKKL